MIDPTQFIGNNAKAPEPEPELETVGGSFVCQDCLQTVKQATLNEDTMSLFYTCSDGHQNEAKL